MMDRRGFLRTFGLSLLAAPLAAEAQPGDKVWRLGYLFEGRQVTGPVWQAFLGALRELGYAEGKNLLLEIRYADGQGDRLPGLAAELVRLKVDLIAAPGTRELLALKAATSTIPIVMLFPGDPVGTGLVSSLTQPGGNITGTSLMFPDIGGKRLELLRETIPTLRRVAVMWNPKNVSAAADMRTTEVAVKSLGLVIHPIGVDSDPRLDAALAEIARDRPDGLLVLQDALIISRRQDIAATALRSRVPSAFPGRAYVESGGLFGYGPDLRAIAARAATYIDKILKGAKPADLPVEQPTKFELVINLKTAKALGITIPPAVLARADEIIQ